LIALHLISGCSRRDFAAGTLSSTPMTVRPVAESDTVAAARQALASARRPRASAPGPGSEQLRRAYLELLKLALCDLTGISTISVGRAEDGVASRELTGDQLGVRVIGMDWPLQGLTMIGLERLDDLQRCVESVVCEGIEGDLIEAGVWRGGAAIMARATLDSLGAGDRMVWVADSFRGFPGVERSEDRWEQIDYLSVPAGEVKANFERLGLDGGVQFVEGYFAETLPALRDNRWSLIRLDGDTYESTLTALESLYPQLSVGGYLIVDDYGALRECRTAVDEFRAAHRIEEPFERVDWTCVRWRRSEARFHGEPLRQPESGTRAAVAEPKGESARRRDGRVPSLHELSLERELAAVRVRLEASDAELARMRAMPLRTVGAGMRRKLSRGHKS
jgi:O-methyltransferase